MRILMFVIATVFTFQTLFTQEYFANHFKGVVIDAATNVAIPHVHFIYSNSKGFTSDENGIFHFVDSLKSLNVKISCIGYQTRYIALTANNEHTIYLKGVAEKLSEIELVYIDKKKELLKKVIKNIPKNYPSEKEIITGIVHERVFMDSLSQDTIYSATYNVKFNKLDYSKKHKTGNLSLFKGEAKFNKVKDSIPTIFYGVLHSVHSKDIIMNRTAPLDLKKLNDYKLTIKDTLQYENSKLIRLAFLVDDLHGNLFIDSKSFAVVKGEYWLSGQTSALERLRGFERKERYFSVYYGLYPDNKWRLKFIQFSGKYIQRIEKKVLTFFLKDGFIIRKFEPTREIIPFEKTLAYNTPGVLAENVTTDLNTFSTNDHKLKNSLKIYTFFNKLRIEYAIKIFPLQIQSYSSYFTFLDENISNPEDKRRNLLTFNYSFFYALQKTLQIELSFTKSISKKTLSANSIGISKLFNLDSFGRFNFSLGIHGGYRQVYDNPIEHSFEGDLSIRNKIFKKGTVSIYLGQKEYYFSPQGSLNCRLSNHLMLSLNAMYYSPFSSYPSVAIEDFKGLFRKSMSYRIESKDIVKNKFSYGVGLVINL